MSPTRMHRPPESGPSFFVGDDEFTPTVLAWRPHSRWDALHTEVARSDANTAGLLLEFASGAAVARHDEARLLELIAEVAFRAFPHATHHVLVARDTVTGELQPLVARSREGPPPPIALSRTIVARVLEERCALLFARGQGHFDAVSSVVMSRLETAICAPLMGRLHPFGVIQLDIRAPGQGRFTSEDVDRLSVFARLVGLALEHLDGADRQRRAFQSAIRALVQASTHESDALAHLERLQAVSLELGRRLSLADSELDVLSMAALLHDLGRVRAQLEPPTHSERTEASETAVTSRHPAYAHALLQMIEFPEELQEVPRIVAHQQERVDGKGPFGVRGSDIPVQALIVSVANAFDALLTSPGRPMAPAEAFARIEQGSGTIWDARVVETLGVALPALLSDVYAAAESAMGPQHPRTALDDQPMDPAA